MIGRELLRAFRRELVAIALLIIPPLLVMPLGALWLLERGGMLAFLAICLGCAVIAGGIMLYRRPKPTAAAREAAAAPAAWPARERAAYDKVAQFAREAPALSFSSQDEAVDL